MHYSYKSNGIVSRSISDYRDNLLSDFSTFRVWEGDKEFTEGQYLTKRISDVNYGTVGDYGSEGINSRSKGSGAGSDIQMASGGILIVGERGTSIISGSAVCFPKYAPLTNIYCGGGRCIYSYEAGNISETVGQHGSSVINMGIGARKISSFQFVFDTWQPISRFVGAAECKVYNYEPCITEDYNELDYGLITANHTSTVDYGSVAEVHYAGEYNYGNILDGYRTRFGFKKIIGEAQARATNAWIGSGRLKSFGKQTSPAIYGWITDGKVKHLPTLFRVQGSADASFTTTGAGGGLTPLSGTAIIGITAVTIGDGNLRKFGGSAESATWNPDEKQMLFSFTGGLTAEKHVEAYVGSGRIKNLAKVEAVTGTFDYVGSGVLYLKPRKPVTYELRELANLTLETAPDSLYWLNKDAGDNTYGWNGPTKIGQVYLKDLNEKDHEKFTVVYDEGAFVEFVSKDYGSLVQTNLTNCVLDSGTISTNTTASSGCIKVAPGTTLAIAPSNTYTIPNLITTPSVFEDYGSVANFNAPEWRDYGWILDTSNLRTPYGLGLRFTSQVDVNVNHIYDWTSTGEGHGGSLLRFVGDTVLPLDVAEYGSGNLFSMGGAAECVANTLGGTGLFRFLSLTHVSRARDFVGSGRIPKFSGAAESTTWNPVERQMLFDFTGVAHASNTDVFVGSGDFSTFSSATETVRWSAQHTTGLYRISGDSHDTRAKAFVGSGSLRKFNGAAESLTFNPDERDMLFSFTGVGTESHTESYIGSGRIRNFAKLEAERGTFDYVGSGSINLKPRKPDVYELRQLSNFTLDFYSLRNGYINFGDLHFFDQQWTKLGGVYLQWLSLEQGHEKHTEAYNNSACEDGVELDYGNLVNQNLTNCVATSGVINTNTTATSGCIKVAPGTTLAIAPSNTYTIPNQLTTPSVTEDYGLVSDANAPEQRDYGHILDTLSKKCPYGFSDIIGAAKTHYVENIITTGYSVTGKAGCSLFGEADTFWTPPYIADGLGRITGSGHESFTPATEIGSGILFSMGGAAETTAQVWKADGLFRIGGASIPLFSLLHPGSGTIRVTGIGGESVTPATHIGSGTLKKFSGAAESTTWNPEEKQLLFSFTGQHEVKFTANPPEEGTEVRISGDAFPVFFVPRYPGYGVIKVTGEGEEPRARAISGSGSLKKFSGAAESLTFNPEEKQLLFSFLGTGTERVTLNPPEEGTNIRLRGEAVYKLESSYDGSGTIPISGDAVSKTTKPFIGSGSLKKFSGAAESITFNPEERQLLFSFTGSGTERISSTPPEGIGVIFSFNGAAETTSVSDDLFGGLFRVDGISVVKSTISHIGSGSFKKFSGAAESVTFNPDERDMLFSFTGVGEQRTSVDNIGSGSIKIYPEASDYRFTPNFNGSGTARVYGVAGYRFAPVWIGSGTLKKFSGAAESITFNPEEKQLLFSFVGQGSDKTSVSETSKGGTINIDGVAIDKLIPNNIGSGTIFVDGIADTRYTPHVIGSGSLWSWSGAAESFTFNPSDLYTFLKVQGSSPSSKSVVYAGSGSLKKFQGAAESITFNPDEKQMLFSFLGESATTRSRSESGQGTVKTLGESTVRFSPVYFGSGTTRVSGEAIVTRARDFVGFGSLRKLSGAAESFTFNPEEKQMLFSFVGEGIQATTSRLISQGGTLAVRGTSGDPLLTFAEQPRVEIDITGDSIDLRTHAYQGSGRISNVNKVDEAFVREGYQGSGQIAISGFAIVAVVVWQPPHTQVWII